MAVTLSGVALAQGFDQYGGWKGLQGHNTSGYFRTEKINGRYWLVTPDNNVFWSTGAACTFYNDSWGGLCPALNYAPNPLGNKAKYATQAAFNAATVARYAAWNLNTSPGFSAQVPGTPEFIRVLTCLENAIALGVPTFNGFCDVFDPRFYTGCDNATKGLASVATNKFTIGSFPNNELRWSRPGGAKTLPDAFIAFPAITSGKQYWVNTFLKARYPAVADLNTAYGTSFTDWTGTGNTVINVTAIPDDAAHPAILADKIDFNEVIADQYYKTVTERMRHYDPNHLVFSARWAMVGSPGTELEFAL